MLLSGKKTHAKANDKGKKNNRPELWICQILKIEPHHDGGLGQFMKSKPTTTVVWSKMEKGSQPQL